MSDQARTREVGNGRGRGQGERVSTERYGRSPNQARGRIPARLVPGPLEFDEDGFPIAQRSSSFIARVTRLRSPE